MANIRERDVQGLERDSDSEDQRQEFGPNSTATKRRRLIRQNLAKKPKIWDFLKHAGPLFAPEYKRLPKNVFLKYEGKPVVLSEKPEELATLYAKMAPRKLSQDGGVLQTNFFIDWRASMTLDERELITDFSMCDFSVINKHVKENAASWRKSVNPSVLKSHRFCTVDDRLERVKNCMIDRVWIFQGSARNPLAGKVKRINPEDVTINCSSTSIFPVPPEGHSWKKVVHDNTGTWLASWPCTVTGSTTYMTLHDVSKLKKTADHQKFGKARELAKYKKEIRSSYKVDLADDDSKEKRQRGAALYLIDKLSLRPGFEKLTRGADTFGVCSLLVEHVSFNFKSIKSTPNSTVVVFKFRGKDSIMYKRNVVVNSVVYKILKDSQRKKEPTDTLFDTLAADDLNLYLKTFMVGLTAKVYRTTGACQLFQKLLDNSKPAGKMLSAKIKLHEEAVREIAKLLNHCRSKNNRKPLKRLQNEVHNRQYLVKKSQNRIVQDPENQDKENQQVIRQQEKLQTLEPRIKALEDEMEPNLMTAFNHFLDPRITFAWCKRWNVPPKTIFKGILYGKFEWANDTDKDWRF